MAGEKDSISQLSASLDFEEISDEGSIFVAVAEPAPVDPPKPDASGQMPAAAAAVSAPPATAPAPVVAPPVTASPTVVAAPPVAASPPVTAVPPVIASPPVTAVPAAPYRPRAARSLRKKKGADNFARNVAFFALLGLAVFFLGIQYFRYSNRNEAALSYLSLPEHVVNLEGHVVRLQVTLQASADDREWLLEHRQILADTFRKETARLDLEKLNKEKDLQAAQEQLKTALNEATHTDKIQSVLLAELLAQSR